MDNQTFQAFCATVAVEKDSSRIGFLKEQLRLLLLLSEQTAQPIRTGMQLSRFKGLKPSRLPDSN
jgi:hypothetical protein